jgi:hypothetical protein
VTATDAAVAKNLAKRMIPPLYLCPKPSVLNAYCAKRNSVSLAQGEKTAISHHGVRGRKTGHRPGITVI